MLARAYSAAVTGIDASRVEIEVDIRSGQPSWSLVGLPTAAVKESRDRIRTAILNAGLPFPEGSIVVNMAPADLRKESASLDLALALAILAASGQVSAERLGRCTCYGELALDSKLRPVRGALSVAISLLEGPERGRLLLPRDNANEAGLARDVDIYGVSSLAEAVAFLNGKTVIEPTRVDPQEVFERNSGFQRDLNDVKGQEQVKRALEIAAAGAHNLLLIGPPGSGKTMLAKRLSTILPPLSFREALETTRIHSVAGKLEGTPGIVATRPFRSPHHTISDAGLIGGGSNPGPGEVSLSHNGVLFLDEFPEFRRSTLEVLRQPLENGDVTISRATASYTYPARFVLVAAMNPSPSGYFPDDQRCTSSVVDVQRYLSKISGPLLDRIDLHIEVQPVPLESLSGARAGETSAQVRERVIAARRLQIERFAGSPHMHANAHMGARELDMWCRLDEGCARLLESAMRRLNLSARAYDRILKVARTIADLARSPHIGQEHLAEAIQYRSLDRVLGR